MGLPRASFSSQLSGQLVDHRKAVLDRMPLSDQPPDKLIGRAAERRRAPIRHSGRPHPGTEAHHFALVDLAERVAQNFRDIDILWRKTCTTIGLCAAIQLRLETKIRIAILPPESCIERTFTACSRTSTADMSQDRQTKRRWRRRHITDGRASPA